MDYGYGYGIPRPPVPPVAPVAPAAAAAKPAGLLGMLGPLGGLLGGGMGANPAAAPAVGTLGKLGGMKLPLPGALGGINIWVLVILAILVLPKLSAVGNFFKGNYVFLLLLLLFLLPGFGKK